MSPTRKNVPALWLFKRHMLNKFIDMNPSTLAANNIENRPGPTPKYSM